MRHLLKIVSLFIAFIVLSPSGIAANSLSSATSLRCEFQPGFNADWVAGSPKIVKYKFGGPITFHSINLQERTAKMTGNTSTVPLVALATSQGITFLEEMDGDVVVVTTIYQQHPGGDQSRYTAVHSRHRITVSAQYHGTCVAL